MELEEILSSVAKLFPDTTAFMAFRAQINGAVTGIKKNAIDELTVKKDEEIATLKKSVSELSLKPIDDKFYAKFKNDKEGKDKVDNTEIVKKLVSTEELSEDPQVRQTQLDAFAKKYESYLNTLEVKATEEPKKSKEDLLGISNALIEKATKKHNAETKEEPEDKRTADEMFEDLEDNIEL